MNSPKSKSIEAQQEEANDKVFELITKAKAVIEAKNEFPPKSHQYAQYNELLNELSVYISWYSSDVESLTSKLKSLPIRPDTAVSLNAYYKVMVTIAEELRNDIDGNRKFRININNTTTLSNEYLEHFKDSVLEIDRLTLINESTRKANENLLKEKSSIEGGYINLKNELDATITQSKAFQSSVTELEAAVSKHITDKNKVEAELATANKELTHFKEVAQKTEVARNSTNFLIQAEANKKAAKNWGIWILVVVVLFLASIVFVFSTSGELFDMASDMVKRSKEIEPDLMKQLVMIEIIKKVSTRLIFFSMIIYSISFLVKNYNAQMHNYMINSHKANALRSTVDLIGTAKQDDGNDKIILQATQAIFTTQKSGYQGAENEPTSPNLITNVIDAVSSSGKKG